MNIESIRTTTESPEETFEFGRRLGCELRGGDVLTLSGDLGAGKTRLAKGIASGLGFRDSDRVTSPTFVIAREYEGERARLIHVDAYRLEGAEDLHLVGGHDWIAPGNVVVIEWPERIDTFLWGVPHLVLKLEGDGAGFQRTIGVRPSPGFPVDRFEDLRRVISSLGPLGGGDDRSRFTPRISGGPGDAS